MQRGNEGSKGGAGVDGGLGPGHFLVTLGIESNGRFLAPGIEAFAGPWLSLSFSHIQLELIEPRLSPRDFERPLTRPRNFGS